MTPRKTIYLRKTCYACGIRFDALNYRQTYCTPRCRDRAGYQKHREKYLAYAKEQRKKNKDLRERQNIYSSKYYWSHAEKCRLKARISSMPLEQQEKMRATRRRYYAKNRDLVLAIGRKHRAKRRAAHPWRGTFENAKERAREKKWEFNITPAWCAERYTGRCEVTGIVFALGKQMNGFRLFNPSIDRIDNAKGYTTDNCRFVLHAINSLKADGTDDDMYTIAEALIANRPK